MMMMIIIIITIVMTMLVIMMRRRRSRRRKWRFWRKIDLSVNFLLLDHLTSEALLNLVKLEFSIIKISKCWEKKSSVVLLKLELNLKSIANFAFHVISAHPTFAAAVFYLKHSQLIWDKNVPLRRLRPSTDRKGSKCQLKVVWSSPYRKLKSF